MRIMIKGGVWKNTEDEILKAAVMKYGKNQWARISSLLVRKSAKQCKARWYEWLDPSIKKIEWTREEDEKLLHLAKLMPTQWRTIAPIVGRTPAQCLERYEKLLDQACFKDENYEAGDDPRRLRPGEIDPNPESKPARPDPVDMDEDEKEMLSEARARLANTRGKKAKRKAREKQLEEARRLASLQKRRELKAAGLDQAYRKRKQRGIDYNAEIPFEKKPPPGFYETLAEDRVVNQPQFPTTVEDIEGKRRVDVEAALRRHDVARNKIAQRHDAPSTVLQVNKLNDPEAVRRRSKLTLPAPQISDRELEEIAKMGYASDLAGGADDDGGAEGGGGGGGGGAATRALLANYGGQRGGGGATPQRTPQRTPGGKGDAIMMEAENLARLRDVQTPLMGGENPELHASDFSGVTPKRREAATPNPIATPLRTPGGSAAVAPAAGATPTPRGAVGATPGAAAGSTPAGGFNASMTPRGTPIRDELRINEGLDTPLSESARGERARQLEIRQNLRSGLGSLPAPRNEYAIVVPELPEDDGQAGDESEALEPDMSDVLARQKAEEAACEAERLRKRSRALQMSLPRPPPAATDLLASSLRGPDSTALLTSLEEADEMVKAEMVALLRHDAVKYPLGDGGAGQKKKGKGSKQQPNGPHVPVDLPELEDIEEADIKEASALVEEEAEVLRQALGHEDATPDEYALAWESVYDDLIYLPNQDAYGLASVASAHDRLAAQQAQLEHLRRQLEGSTRRGVKVEQKVRVLTQGYQVRSEALWRQLEASRKVADTLSTELECFKALHNQEQMAAPRRIESLQAEAAKQHERERGLQLRYENLLVEREHLKHKLRNHAAAMAASVQAGKDLEDEQKEMEKNLRDEERARKEREVVHAQGKETVEGEDKEMTAAEEVQVENAEEVEDVAGGAEVGSESMDVVESSPIVGPPRPPAEGVVA